MDVNYIPNIFFGYVKDTAGNPLANIPVSNGFQVVKTDENGLYKIPMFADDEDPSLPSKEQRNSYYVYYIIPSDCKVQTDEYGRPCYYKRVKPFHSRYDFTLETMGSAESEFMLFGFADPQCGADAAVVRFSNQVAPEVKEYSASLGVPCYGITLGDIISMGGSQNEEYMFYDMRDAMHADKMGMPVFQVMGNHDNCFMNATNVVQPDTYSTDFNLKIQRPFEDALGPVNYSFNRANAHIIGMRNVQWKSGDNCATANTTTRFTEAQYKWLVDDLACVEDKANKLVVLCVHVPLFNGGTLGDGKYIQETLNLLDEFGEAHILSGHLHYQRNYDHLYAAGSTHKIYEHAQAAVNGASWTSNINGDGVPNGYGVYHISGNTMVDWYYKGYAEGMNDRNYQMRLYRGDAITGAAIPEDAANTSGTMGYYQFGYNNKTLLANVFNSDPRWKVEVYHNGTKLGDMTSLRSYHYAVTYSELVGNYVYDDPKRPSAGVECGRDFWAIGVLCGYLGNNSGGLFYKHCYQMWKYELPNTIDSYTADSDTALEVRATDLKGNTYTCSTITEGTDMTNALYTGETGADTETDDSTDLDEENSANSGTNE